MFDFQIAALAGDGVVHERLEEADEGGGIGALREFVDLCEGFDGGLVVGGVAVHGVEHPHGVAGWGVAVVGGGDVRAGGAVEDDGHPGCAVRGGELAGDCGGGDAFAGECEGQAEGAAWFAAGQLAVDQLGGGVVVAEEAALDDALGDVDLVLVAGDDGVG